MNNSVNATFSQSQKSHNASTRCNNDLKISHKSGVDLTSEFFPPHYGAFVSKEEAREVGGAFYLLDLVPHYTLTKIYKILSKNKLRLFPILVN